MSKQHIENSKLLRSDSVKLKAFGNEIDLIHKKYAAKLGKEDLAVLEQWWQIARNKRNVGRFLAGTCIDPFTFCISIYSLVHWKLSDTMSHMIMHGCYDHKEIQKHKHTYDVPSDLHSKSAKKWWTFAHDVDGWKANHNLKHHYL